MKLYAIAFLCLLAISGCTERDRQKGLFIGGDPALATAADAKEIKNEIAALRSEMNKRFDQIEKQNK